MINLAPKLKYCFLPLAQAYCVTSTQSQALEKSENLLQLFGTKIYQMGVCVGELETEIHDFDTYEVWLIFPENRQISRFFRPSANSNTILLTERCDQYCKMCSQPPKTKDYLHFELYKSAIKYIKGPAVIGISGGEPLLYKHEIFRFLAEASSQYPHIKFHILTNAQHFDEADITAISNLRSHVLWAVPIYSHRQEEHDKIVGKIGAFNKLLQSLAILAKSSARVEIRTVILRENVFNLGNLASFISTIFPWADSWSIMQLEKIGFAKIDWEVKFFDTSSDFSAVAAALDVCIAADVNVNLFNFPRCTVPEKYRNKAAASISDWKVKFFDECKHCLEKNFCAGVFEWYDEEDGYKHIGPIL